MYVMNEKELSRILREKMELQDNQPTPFKTDVLMTQLKDCNGGFISLNKVQGKTEVIDGKLVSVGEKQPDGTYKLEILSKSKNLFNIDNPRALVNGDYKINSNTIRVYSNSSFSTGSIYYIILEPNKSYILKCNITIGGNASGNYTLIRNSNNSDIATLQGASNYVKFTSPSNGLVYIMFGRVGGANDKNGWIDFSNISLIDESLDQTYEPYKEDKTEILLKEPLREWDIIDKNNLVINAKELLWDGNQNWEIEKNQKSGWFQFDDSSVFSYYNDSEPTIFDDSGNCIKCDKLPVGCFETIISKNNEGIVISNSYKYRAIRVQNSRIGVLKDDTDVIKKQKLKTYLFNNPIRIEYRAIKPISIIDLNKTLILEGYEGCNLQVNAGPVQPTVSGTYSTNIGEKIATIEDAVAAINKELGGVWRTFLILADKELRMKSINLLVTNTNEDIKNKINEILTIWR